MINTAVFPRSIPGGGKSSLSTLLKKLAEENGITCSIHSTDSKFYNNGVYVYDRTKVEYFHRLNQDEFITSITNRTNLVILDNTNLALRDFSKYVSACKHTGYNMIDVVFHPDSLQKHFERNVHNVPIENIERMTNKFNKTLQFGQVGHYEVFPDTWKMNIEDTAKKIILGILGN